MRFSHGYERAKVFEVRAAWKMIWENNIFGCMLLRFYEFVA